MTKQKQLLLTEMKRFNAFFSAEDLYGHVSKRDGSLGLATVYRFLKKLVDNGEIHSYVCDRRTVYSTSRRNHCHFRCEVCGVVKHITLDKVDFLKKQIKGSVCHFQLEVTGTCEKCLKENT